MLSEDFFRVERVPVFVSPNNKLAVWRLWLLGLRHNLRAHCINQMARSVSRRLPEPIVHAGFNDVLIFCGRKGYCRMNNC
jgi:hypothetical protein